MTRDDALLKLLALKNLYEHPNTGEHEAEAARAAATRLRKKYDIPEGEQAKPKYRSAEWDDLIRKAREQRKERDRQAGYDDFLRRAQQARDEQQARATRERIKREYEERKAAEEARKQEERRQAAQSRWEDRNRYRDDLGNEVTYDEFVKMMADPFGFAMARDKRTHAQKQEDLQNSFGSRQRMRCAEPLPFYDEGGMPRTRNTGPGTARCMECNGQQRMGEAAWVKGRSYTGWQCCETTPGPRKKKGEN